MSETQGGDGGAWRGALGIVAGVAAFAALHSVLASRPVKRLAADLAGDRGRDGWYRVAYNAQAVVTFAALVAWGRRLPDRTLYDVRGPGAAILRTGQLAGLAWAALAVRAVGLGGMSGLTSLGAWARGQAVVPAEPEAQGPAPDPRAGVHVTGPFRWSRHPLNFAPLPVLWLNPRMTVNLAVFNAAATLYLVAGSAHEERRLAAAYGPAYEAYRRSGVPFYWPRLRPAATETAAPGA